MNWGGKVLATARLPGKPGKARRKIFKNSPAKTFLPGRYPGLEISSGGSYPLLKSRLADARRPPRAHAG